jgi:hypothetical protein
MRLFPNENTGKGWDQNVISNFPSCFFWLCLCNCRCQFNRINCNGLFELHFGVQVMQRNYEVLLGNIAYDYIIGLGGYFIRNEVGIV